MVFRKNSRLTLLIIGPLAVVVCLSSRGNSQAARGATRPICWMTKSRVATCCCNRLLCIRLLGVIVQIDADALGDADHHPAGARKQQARCVNASNTASSLCRNPREQPARANCWPPGRRRRNRHLLPSRHWLVAQPMLMPASLLFAIWLGPECNRLLVAPSAASSPRPIPLSLCSPSNRFSVARPPVACRPTRRRRLT